MLPFADMHMKKLHGDVAWQLWLIQIEKILTICIKLAWLCRAAVEAGA